VLVLNFALHFNILTLDFQGKHAWRQCQTAWNIKNFATSDPNILNPRVSHYNFEDTNIYRYEFPIMQWSIGMVQRVFGQKVLIVRIMLFLFAAFGSIGFYKFLRRIKFDAIPALAGFLFYLFSPVVFYYMINPLPDNFALAASMWYLYFIVSYYDNKKKSHLFWASIFLLLATWAKLPFLMLSIVSIFLFFRNIISDKTNISSEIKTALIQLGILMPALVWYYYVMPGWKGNGILTGVFGMKPDWAENFAIMRYHMHTMFPRILLYASVWIPFFVGLFFSIKRLKNYRWVWWMLGMCFTYLLLQFSVIEYAHDYYLMPFLAGLYIIVAIGVEKLISLKSKLGNVLVLLCLISAPFVSYYVSIDKWYSVWYNKDLYKYRTALINAVPNTERCIMLNDLSKYVFPYQVNKRGYIYN